MLLTETPFFVLQVILGSGALRTTGLMWPHGPCCCDGNRTLIENAHILLSSLDDTFLDMRVLPASTFMHRTVTSSEPTPIKEATQEYSFSGHGGLGSTMLLTETPFFVLQVILGSAALRTTGLVWPHGACCCHGNRTLIGNAHILLSSLDDTFMDMRVLPASTFMHRTVTSSERTAIKEATKEYSFSGHGGLGSTMLLTETLFNVLQVILGSAALRTTELVWPHGACCCDGNRTLIENAHILPSSLDDTFLDMRVLPASTFMHRAVTSSEPTAIKEATQEYSFSGHGGLGSTMLLTGTPFFVLQVILGSAALRKTGLVWPHGACCCDGNRTLIENAHILLSSLDDTFLDMRVLPASKFMHRAVTSSEPTAIKEATQEYSFSGHGGLGSTMLLTETPFFVLQVILGSAALRTTGLVWPHGACCCDGNRTLIENAHILLSSLDDTFLDMRVLPASTFMHRTVTSSEPTAIKEATQEYSFSGHGGLGSTMLLTETPFFVLQVILGSAALRTTGLVWPHGACCCDGNRTLIENAHILLSSLDDTFLDMRVLPASTFMHRTVTSSEPTAIKEATQEYSFSGHGGLGSTMLLTETPFFVLQVILGSAALRTTGLVWPHGACCCDGNRTLIENAHILLSSLDDTFLDMRVLPASTFMHRTVTSSEPTAIKEATQEYSFSGHGGLGSTMLLTETPFNVLQVILGSAALRTTGLVWPHGACCCDGNRTLIENAHILPSSLDDTFLDMRVLPASTFMHRAVTSSEPTAIKEATQEYSFSGHGGLGSTMLLTGTPFFVLQVILGSAALRKTGLVWPHGACCCDGNRTLIENAHILLSSLDDTFLDMRVLPASTFMHRAVTSSEPTAIKEATQEYSFSGHGGLGSTMLLTETPFFVLQVILGSAALRTTGLVWPHGACCCDGNRTLIENAHILLSSLDDTFLDMRVLPASTFMHRTVTSSEPTAIKEATQEYSFSGHGGLGSTMLLTGTPFFVLQVILGSAALRTTGLVWPHGACCCDGNRTLIENAHILLSSLDDTFLDMRVLPASTFMHRTVTSSEPTAIKEATQEYSFSGHGGLGSTMLLTGTPFFVLQVILGSAALRTTGLVWPHGACCCDRNRTLIENAHILLSSLDDTFLDMRVLPASTFMHRTVTSSEPTAIKEATQEYSFSGHGGLGSTMLLTETPFNVLQVILGSAALRTTGLVWPHGACCCDGNRTLIENAHILPSSLDDTFLDMRVLPASTFMHRAVTSSEPTAIKEATQEYSFSGHGGLGSTMLLTGTPFFVLQVILGSAALRKTGLVWPHGACCCDGNRTLIENAHILLSSLDDTFLDMRVLPASTFMHRTVTSLEPTAIKEATQEYSFSGHGGLGSTMLLTDNTVLPTAGYPGFRMHYEQLDSCGRMALAAAMEIGLSSKKHTLAVVT
ncbi:hypothetical protein V5799_001248 [Amblyomma americanum]|uniref:Uncharacterized protein n=1 Tax=Amblyomma americanum TaxID=6943 RepID=A0AAQ4D0Q4_AMBAM